MFLSLVALEPLISIKLATTNVWEMVIHLASARLSAQVRIAVKRKLTQLFLFILKLQRLMSFGIELFLEINQSLKDSFLK